jgi:hypothetical protein
MKSVAVPAIRQTLVLPEANIFSLPRLANVNFLINLVSQ